jgi:hypothetical protein
LRSSAKHFYGAAALFWNGLATCADPRTPVPGSGSGHGSIPDPDPYISRFPFYRVPLYSPIFGISGHFPPKSIVFSKGDKGDYPFRIWDKIVLIRFRVKTLFRRDQEWSPLRSWMENPDPYQGRNVPDPSHTVVAESSYRIGVITKLLPTLGHHF